jgi:hypothetical protein
LKERETGDGATLTTANLHRKMDKVGSLAFSIKC